MCKVSFTVKLKLKCKLENVQSLHHHHAILPKIESVERLEDDAIHENGTEECELKRMQSLLHRHVETEMHAENECKVSSTAKPYFLRLNARKCKTINRQVADPGLACNVPEDKQEINTSKSMIMKRPKLSGDARAILTEVYHETVLLK